MVTHLANEAELVSKARRGDTEAFTILAKQYYQPLYRLALKITGNPEDAEDVTQEAILKAFSNCKHFRATSRFYTWLVRITVNQALMKLRKKRAQRELPLEDFVATADGDNEMPREFEDSSPNPEACYARAEMQETISKAMGNLSPRLGLVFILRNVDGLSLQETSQALGLSLSALKSRLLRARLMLRRNLAGMVQQEASR